MLLTSFLVGMAWWVVIVALLEHHTLSPWMDSQPLQLRGVVIEPVKRAPDRLIMTIDVADVQQGTRRHAASGILRLTWHNADREIYQGDPIEVTTRLREPYGTRNPGGFDYGRYLKRKGIHAVATVSGPGQVAVGSSDVRNETRNLLAGVDQWRAYIHRAAEATLSDPALGLFLGMIIGEQSYLAPSTRKVFMDTGTVHIISISGSHLGLIAFLVFFAVKGIVLRLPQAWLEWLSLRVTATRLAVLVTFPCVTFYTLLAGGEVATVRSWIMITLFLVAVWLGRDKHLLTALGIAALFIVAQNPQAIYDISFQLSYGAVLAIALVLRRSPEESEDALEPDPWPNERQGFFNSTWQWIKQVSVVTLAVTIATIPIVAYHFNQMGWLGVVANLIVVPFVGVLVIPLGLFSAVWVLLFDSDTLPFASINQVVSDTLVEIVTGLSYLPGAEWHVASPSVFAIVVFYGLLLCALLWRDRQGLRWGCVFGVVLMIGWWAWSPRYGQEENTLRVTFLDVGQGDATVIELPDGQTILIDAGPRYRRLDMGQAVIGPYLWDRGIRRLDHVIATHPQWDHVGGMPWVLETFEVGRYWSNGAARERQFYRRLEQSLREINMQESHAEDGQIILRSDSCVLSVTNPMLRTMTPSETSRAMESGSALNNRSLVTLLQCGLHSFLFTADIEKDALRRLNQLPERRTAQVVKVPHHGAKSSFHKGWIENLEADVAVVSVGQHNRYGHPYPSVIAAYEDRGILLYRTDRDGAVWMTVDLDSSAMAIHTARNTTLQPIQLNENILMNEWENVERAWTKWIGEF